LEWSIGRMVLSPTGVGEHSARSTVLCRKKKKPAGTGTIRPVSAGGQNIRWSAGGAFRWASGLRRGPL